VSYEDAQVKRVKKKMPRAVKNGGSGTSSAKPRGKVSAYAYFVSTCRDEHKKKHPNESVVFAEFSRKCADRWRTMTDKEKKRFQELALADKKRFEKEMEGYVPDTKGKKKAKKEKDPNAPKRPLTAFFLFCNDRRPAIKAKNPDLRIGDVAKELGKMWAELAQDAKSKYEAKAKTDKARYDQLLADYQSETAAAAQAHDDDDEEEEDEDSDD